MSVHSSRTIRLRSARVLELVGPWTWYFSHCNQLNFKSICYHSKIIIRITIIYTNSILSLTCNCLQLSVTPHKHTQHTSDDIILLCYLFANRLNLKFQFQPFSHMSILLRMLIKTSQSEKTFIWKREQTFKWKVRARECSSMDITLILNLLIYIILLVLLLYILY